RGRVPPHYPLRRLRPRHAVSGRSRPADGVVHGSVHAGRRAAGMSVPADDAHARLVAAVPYAAWLDIRVEPAVDACTYRLPFRADLVGNPRLPALHGGVVASFLELAMQFEV